MHEAEARVGLDPHNILNPYALTLRTMPARTVKQTATAINGQRLHRHFLWLLMTPVSNANVTITTMMMSTRASIAETLMYIMP